jgi:hypothetical protein
MNTTNLIYLNVLYIVQLTRSNKDNMEVLFFVLSRNKTINMLLPLIFSICHDPIIYKPGALSILTISNRGRRKYISFDGSNVVIMVVDDGDN